MKKSKSDSNYKIEFHSKKVLLHKDEYFYPEKVNTSPIAGIIGPKFALFAGVAILFATYGEFNLLGWLIVFTSGKISYDISEYTDMSSHCKRAYDNLKYEITHTPPMEIISEAPIKISDMITNCTSFYNTIAKIIEGYFSNKIGNNIFVNNRRACGEDLTKPLKTQTEENEEDILAIIFRLAPDTEVRDNDTITIEELYSDQETYS